jgi:hypothetical protein
MSNTFWGRKADMTKRLIQILGIGLALLIFIIVLRVAVGLRPSAVFQGDAAKVIQTKFDELNIPLKSVRVLKESPLEVEVILQKPAGQPSEITWERFLAWRLLMDAEQSMGIPLVKYNLKIVDSEGNVGYNEMADLRLKPVRPTSTTPSTSEISDEDSKSLFLKELKFQDVQLHSLDVRKELSLDASTKLLQINLSVDIKNMDAANHQIDTSIGEVIMATRELNESSGTRITIVQVKITDRQGVLLIHYIHDLENLVEMVWHADNVDVGWMPEPAPLFTPTPITSATPHEPYPLPTYEDMQMDYPPPNPYP